MGSNDTPPTGTKGLGPPRSLPTLASVEATVAALSGQVRGARENLDTIARQVAAMHRHLGLDGPVVRFSPVPETPPSTPPPRPSKAAEAAKMGGTAGRWLLVGAGALTLVGQGLSMLNNPKFGPIIAALEAIKAALGGAQ